MNTGRYEEWQPIRIFAEGLQPHTAKHWNVEPAWNVVAVYREPDAIIPHPDHFLARRPGAQGEFPNRDRGMAAFWDRHIDRRFHVEYRHAQRDVPRVQGVTLGDTQREWDTLIEWRDRLLREAGLTLSSPARQVARAMSETFRHENFVKKPTCTTFPGTARNHVHVIEGLIHASWCVGCSRAFMGLADACGLPVRGVGMPGHHVAEVCADGDWFLADPAGRHHAGDPVWFEGSYHDTMLDPMYNWKPAMPDAKREGFWGRPYGIFDFHGGQWDVPGEVYLAARSAHALYPGNKRYGFKSADGKRMPIFIHSCGFIWPGVNSGYDEQRYRQLRANAFPDPADGVTLTGDFLFHPFQPGQKLRQSFYLGDKDMESIEITFTFAPSKMSDWSAAAGAQMRVKVGEFTASLSSLNAWPPRPMTPDEEAALPGANRNLWHSTVTLKPELFQGDAVNWVELQHQGRGLYYVPCVTAMLEPYIAPLWAETEDAFRPAVLRLP